MLAPVFAGNIYNFVPMVNSIGRLLRLTTFGESHGAAVGGILDGCPSGITVDEEEISLQLHRRSAGINSFSSSRIEKDQVEFLSGIRNGQTLGTPIAFLVRNTGQLSQDYESLKNVYRPSHADYSWEQKFGISSGSGGGRTSARALLPCVVAGTIARNIILLPEFSIIAWVSSIGQIETTINPLSVTTDNIEASPLRCPDKEISDKMLKFLDVLKKSGDTAGGIISCLIKACPLGLGEPAFGKLHADIAHAIMNINSVKGFEYGEGFHSSSFTGSQYNDSILVKKGKVVTATNHDGGINGGISNGGNIFFKCAFKPIPSISIEQKTITHDKKPALIKINGRHDTCAVPRAVPIVEAMAALIIADHFLMQKSRK